MKAIVSTTYDDKYLFFLPIVTWCWNKLGIDVICFMPTPKSKVFVQAGEMSDFYLEMGAVNAVFYCMNELQSKIRVERFNCPDHKEVTYAQCSRLYAAALDLPDDEVLITSDVDMAVFKNPPYIDCITIFGGDLTPEKQFPICYASGKANAWRNYFEIGARTIQNCLDDLLGDIECENMKGNYWGKDQEVLYDKTVEHAAIMNRARPHTQFASHRADRDDQNWRSYLGPDLIDAHLWRPGYTDENFANIVELLTTQYPNEDFQWLIDYRNEYIKLL